MENTKHTPGTWGWEEGTPTITKEWNGMKACVAQVKGADLHWHEDWRMAFVEAEANARLIAAAPDLLEVAAMVLETIDGGGPVVTFQEAHIAQLRAAIAKATQPWHTITPS